MTKVLAIVVGAVLLLPLAVLLSAAIGGLFVWQGWNHTYYLFNATPIHYSEAFWLCILFRALFTVSVTKSD